MPDLNALCDKVKNNLPACAIVALVIVLVALVIYVIVSASRKNGEHHLLKAGLEHNAATLQPSYSQVLESSLASGTGNANPTGFEHFGNMREAPVYYPYADVRGELGSYYGGQTVMVNPNAANRALRMDVREHQSNRNGVALVDASQHAAQQGRISMNEDALFAQAHA